MLLGKKDIGGISLNEKTIFAMFVIVVVAIIQGYAWYIGVDGQVFAFTSLVIGLAAGSILGFSFNARGGAKSKE